MNILIWILLGLVAGFLAKAIMPGRQGGGWIATILLGIVGALVGTIVVAIMLPFFAMGEVAKQL